PSTKYSNGEDSSEIYTCKGRSTFNSPSKNIILFGLGIKGRSNDDCANSNEGMTSIKNIKILIFFIIKYGIPQKIGKYQNKSSICHSNFIRQGVTKHLNKKISLTVFYTRHTEKRTYHPLKKFTVRTPV